MASSPGAPLVTANRSRFGDSVFVLFSGVQVADGWLTYLGIHAYGTTIEANPVIAWYMAAFGVTAALVGAKVLAVFCGAILHLTARHQLMAVLTAGYLAAAIFPWARLLWP